MKVELYDGAFAVGTQSDLFRIIATTGTYESEVSQICVRYLPANRDVVDIGANIGLYSVMFARKMQGRRVLAIETTPGALARLRRNIAMNGVEQKVIVHAGVASDHDGDAQINLVPGREEYSSMGGLLHPAIDGAAHESLRVSSATLDNLVSVHGLDPGFIKMDVEGMEHVVLKGMSHVLLHHRPVIVTELSDPLLRGNGSSAQDVIRFIQGFGYSVLDAHNHEVPAGLRTSGEILCLPPAMSPA